MKILSVVKTNEGAAWAYRHTAWLLENKPGQYEFTVVLPQAEGGYADEYRKIGCKVIGYDISIPVTHPWRFFAIRKEVRRLVKEENPDLIHTHFVTNILMLRLCLGKKSVKRIFQVPGPLHLENLFFRLADRLTISKNDYLVGACEWTCAQYLKMGVPKDKVFLDYYGGRGTAVPEGSDILHREYGIASDQKIVGMVSYFYAPKYYLFQFTGLKGHEDFLRAMAIVRKSHPEAVAVIIGSAWGKKAERYEQKVHRFAKRVCPEGIIFTGRRSDVAKVYPEFSVAVHPSHSENIGGAGESLGLAVPTVSTNVGGFPDVVKNGISGWTVPPRSPKKLADKIIWTLEHEEEAKKMAQVGRSICAENFDIDKTGRILADIYDEVYNHP